MRSSGKIAYVLSLHPELTTFSIHAMPYKIINRVSFRCNALQHNGNIPKGGIDI